MSSARARAVIRRKFFLLSLFMACGLLLVAGVAAWAQDNPSPEPASASPVQEVAEEIKDVVEALPVPDPTPAPTPEATPAAPVFAPRQDVEVAPTAKPDPDVALLGLHLPKGSKLVQNVVEKNT